MKTTVASDNERVVDLIVENTRTLLNDHWQQILEFRADANDGIEEVKVGLSHALSYDGRTRTVKSTISFSHRVKDSIEESIDLDQIPLFSNGG